MAASDALELSDHQHYKDSILDQIARRANVAQFVSFGPGIDLPQRFCHIRNRAPNHLFDSAAAALTALLKASASGTVNVRSYWPHMPKGGEFLYGLTTVDDVLAHLSRLASSGLFTIVNETLNVNDGGVSGVAIGNLVEFAPEDTPRCVEKPGTCRFERTVGVELLRAVYGFCPALEFAPNLRVEFSVHPLRCGVRNEHTIIWELENVDHFQSRPEVEWPNRFSRIIGDKAFGLLVANSFGLPVPKTIVVPRKLAPFIFGSSTGTSEPWIRTCPITQQPGRFTTRRGWTDPFVLLSEEDAQQPYQIASILLQEGIEAEYSGALAYTDQGSVLLEGVSGSGEQFMLGQRAPEAIPQEVREKVVGLFERARRLFGSVRLEWVFDGKNAWVVQMHKGSVSSSADIIVPGEPVKLRDFDVALGLESLRLLISEVEQTGEGIVLHGDVGITSHFGDLLRKAGVSSRIKRT